MAENDAYVAGVSDTQTAGLNRHRLTVADGIGAETLECFEDLRLVML